jgi:hypothetical protein
MAMMVDMFRRSRASTYYECEHCGYDLRKTPALCPECGHVPERRRRKGRVRMARLLATAPADGIVPRRPDPSETRVVIYQTDLYDDAATLREHLDARGITCDLRTLESSNPIPGSATAPPVYHELSVWSGDEEPARALVSMATRDCGDD